MTTPTLVERIENALTGALFEQTISQADADSILADVRELQEALTELSEQRAVRLYVHDSLTDRVSAILTKTGAIWLARCLHGEGKGESDDRTGRIHAIPETTPRREGRLCVRMV